MSDTGYTPSAGERHAQQFAAKQLMEALAHGHGTAVQVDWNRLADNLAPGATGGGSSGQVGAVMDVPLSDMARILLRDLLNRAFRDGYLDPDEIEPFVAELMRLCENSVPAPAAPSDKREALAAVAHEIWAHWMGYLFSRCEQNPDGSVTIPVGLVLRWGRQVDTPYSELSEQERESDRHQADKILAVLKSAPDAGDGERRPGGHPIPPSIFDAIRTCAATIKIAFFRKNLDYVDAHSALAADRIEKWLDTQKDKTDG